MKNSDILPEIRVAFKRVPRFQSNWRYVPLHRLPPGTLIKFSTKDAIIPPDERMYNNSQDKQVIRMAAHVYGLVVFQWPTLLLSGFGPTTKMIKPYANLLAPSSVIEANYDERNETFRLISGVIEKIWLPDTDITLGIDDCFKKKNRQQRNHTPLRER